MAQLNILNSVINCNTSVLNIDEACLVVNSAAENNIQLWAQSEECISCDYQPWYTVGALENASFTVKTTFPLLLRYSFNASKWCLRNVTFKEYGVYGWNISDDACSDLYIIKKPDSQFLPLIVAVCLLLLLSIISYASATVVESGWFTNLWRRNLSFTELENDLGSPNPGDAPPIIRNEVLQIIRRQNRVASVDIFRGLCLALMIFVNYGGGHYWFFKHSVWNGLTVADLVFPWFMWIMGLSLAISLRTQLRSSKPRLHVLGHVLRRSLFLIALGVILNSCGNHGTKPDVKTLRLPGVLQRLGVCYMVIGTIESLLMSREGAFRYGRYIVLSDIIESWCQWLVVIALATGHVAISLALPVPGCPRGYLGPGGWHMHGQYANCTGGAAGYIDRLILTPQHMYKNPTCKSIYHNDQVYDPEGILGTLTSILMVYLGVHAGRILQCYNYTFMRISRWLSWGVVTGILAGILCHFSKEDGIIPVNKNLWSLSYVLATASMAFLLLSILYFVADCHRWWSGAPFIYAGMNSLVLYVGHELTRHMFPWSWKPLYNNHSELLAMNIWGTALWLIIAYFMYRKDCFVTV
ncbi:heparan-alpha-glucosaminide N-acetyltransferase-like [Schistocerca cancellata]|uniref:heparan-alpha-glucosaminide N-acetyltransferase-like n=1 Tax=Schistocerca cancellata TaxID=274614 RepID=UPI002117B37C|nr:heparan-alpha-glucosaminide N-acetyltransferase-like [Schistocerca cancellata]